MPNLLYDALIGKRDTSDAPLLISADGRVTSYAEMAARVAVFAALLVERGLTKGDRVAVQVPKSADALALYLACLRQGLIFLPLNTAYTPDEVGYFLENAAPGMTVVDPNAASAIAPLASAAGSHLLTMGQTGEGTFSEASATAGSPPEIVECSADDLACFLYTSGTTGRSKGAMLTHGNLFSNASTLARSWRFTENDRLLHALPIFHAHGLFVASNVLLLVGGSMIWLPGFKVDEVLSGLPHATSMMGVPTFYTRLLQSPEFTREATAHIRLFTSGSAPLLAETHTQFSERTGHAILERYGMTETGMNTSNPYDGERRPGTVGFPLEGVEVRVTDPESGTSVPTGETGMIEVRGPNVFKGYWKMPEKTAEELRANGFFITGDIGRIDEDGYVHIVGRQKDLIISGGYNVYPKEVELILDEQDGVLESAVVGVPHPDFGEAVVAVVVAEEARNLNIEAITSAVALRLANYKRPKIVILIDALPRNTMGKVQKNILREQHAKLFEDPGPQRFTGS